LDSGFPRFGCPRVVFFLFIEFPLRNKYLSHLNFAFKIVVQLGLN